jgi:hypothetical protein
VAATLKYSVMHSFISIPSREAEKNRTTPAEVQYTDENRNGQVVMQ